MVMAEYLSPGVYIEEFEIGAKPIEGIGTSTAGFLGETERGPTVPTLVTSWLQYQRVFGGSFGDSKYLPYAVQGFFENGGSRCYIGRIVKKGSLSATYSLPAAAATSGDATAGGDTTTGNDAGKGAKTGKAAKGGKGKPEGSNTWIVSAVGEGDWGNNIAVLVSNSSTNPKKEFKLNVIFWQDQKPDSPFDPKTDLTSQPRPSVTEEFDDLSTDKTSPNYYEKRINGISQFIILKNTDSGDPVDLPQRDFIHFLENGKDATGTIDVSDYERTDIPEPGNRRGLTAFGEIDEISIVYAPDTSSIPGLDSKLISHCENLKSRFAIIDAPSGQNSVPNIDPRSKISSDYAAYYYPWIKVISGSAEVSVPPGGHVAGIYARSDNERGVYKAPANEIVRGASNLEFQITKGEQDILNPRGVNVIRAFPGRGILVWGARTLSSNTLWKYINVRRLFIYIEGSIEAGTQWVVFEPNDEKLWGRVCATITQFLTGVWHDGALMGTKPEEAFFVKCDRTTMTQDDIDNGRLVCIIGIAPVKPAEFVIFRIAQWQGGSAVTE
jgi:hypothetical protein